MNFGIIGFGRIARKFVQAIEATEEGRIYAIGSHTVSMDDPYLKEHKEIKVYKDYEELLSDPQVDAVYVALTHKFHKEWILKSLEHHIPVLSEKPLVLTVKDVEEIKEKVNETNTLCTEALKTKFNTGYDHLKEDLKTIGEIMIPNYNRIIDYTIHWKDGTTETKSYPFKGNDMTMQIQDFIDDVKNGKVQSEKHCLADTKKILEVSEMM